MSNFYIKSAADNLYYADEDFCVELNSSAAKHSTQARKILSKINMETIKMARLLNQTYKYLEDDIGEDELVEAWEEYNNEHD